MIALKMTENNEHGIWNVLHFSCLILGFSFVFTLAVLMAEVSTDKLIFILLTGFVLVYAIFEISKIKKKENGYWLINPAVLASLYLFIAYFGVTNFIYLIPSTVRERIIDFTGYNKAMFCIFIALISMWRGYHSKFASSMTRSLKQNKFLKNIIRKTYALNIPVVLFFVGLSFITRLVQIKMGVFGYSSEMDDLYKFAQYTQFLTLLGKLNYLALIGLALNYYSSSSFSNLKIRGIFFSVFFIELTFGFLSGFKSAVVMPIIVVGLCYYLAKQKIPKKLIIFACLFMWIAYSVIEPFRVVRYGSSDFNSRSISSISNTMTTVVKNAELQDFNSFIFAFVSRMNLVSETATAIKYDDENVLSNDSPAFLANLFLSPLHAIIPRFIWTSKPFSNLGRWFAVEVCGASYDTVSAIGMSPVGYLYFAGGFIAVFFGFFTVGILQRTLYDGFLKIGSGGMIVYLSLLGILTNITSDFSAVYVSIIRFFILAVLFQKMLFKK